MRIFFKINYIIIVCGFCMNCFAQDIHFSQYNTMSNFINPAYTGVSGGIQLTNNYRSQWANIDGGFKTFCFSYSQYSKYIMGGIGLSYYYDKAGNNLTSNYTSLTYSPHFQIADKLVIKPALEFAYSTQSVDFGMLTFASQYPYQSGGNSTPNYPTGIQKISFFDLSSGILVYGKKFYGGFAARHLMRPNVSFLENNKGSLERAYMFNVGLIIPTDSAQKLSVSPTILYTYQGSITTFLPGITVKYKMIVVGVCYRVKDAVILGLGCQRNKFKITYTYDNTISSFSEANPGGAHEISLLLWLNYKNADEKKLFIKPIAF